MPELPEVEAIAVRARRHSIERRILDVRVLRGRYLENQIDLIKGKWIKEVFRRGKYVIFELMDVHGDTQGFMVCHNAMSGYWDYLHEPWTFDYVEGKRKAGPSDVRVEIDLDPGGSVLRFHDSRMFGRIKFHEKLDKIILGPEAISTDRMLPGSPVMTEELFVNEIVRCHGAIKPQLMSQVFMAGVGNIYAAEACGWAGIRPDRPSHTLKVHEATLLFQTVQELLNHNVPTIRYNWLRFYRKKVCQTCEKGIVKIEQEGRTTWFCPHCQR